MRTIALFLLSLLLFFSEPAHGRKPQGPALVSIFCAELSRYSRSGSSGSIPDGQWQVIASDLEHRVAEPVSEADRMDDCQRVYRNKFEQAEFILNGKQLLERSIRDFKRTRQATASAAGPSDVVLAIPGLGGLAVPASPRAPDSSQWLTQAESRQSHYRDLWTRFLTDLHEQVAASPVIFRSTADTAR